MRVVNSFAQRAVSSMLVGGLGLGLGSGGCNGRFQFDLPVAGAAGTADMAGAGAGGTADMAGAGGAGGSAGASFGGSVEGGGVAGNAVAGFAGSGGTAGSVAGSGGSSGEASQTACGDLAACPAGLYCDQGMCWQCAQDADCAVYGLPRCEPTRHRCVSCVATADCEPDFACDSLANRCLKKCSEDLDCKGQHGCDERRQVCYKCDEDRECVGSPLGGMCASDRSGCVQCLRDTDCPGQHCDQLVGRCVDCRDGLDCDSRLCSPDTFTCLPN